MLQVSAKAHGVRICLSYIPTFTIGADCAITQAKVEFALQTLNVLVSRAEQVVLFNQASPKLSKQKKELLSLVKERSAQLDGRTAR